MSRAGNSCLRERGGSGCIAYGVGVAFKQGSKSQAKHFKEAVEVTGVIVAKLDGSGTLLWSTFLGGSETDEGTGITVDPSGTVLVTGRSTSSWGSPVRAYSGGLDGFAAKLDSGGTGNGSAFCRRLGR